MEQGHWKMEFTDGNSAELCLNYMKLYMLRESGAKGKSVYDTYMGICRKEMMDELDQTYILYTAYVCANLGTDYMDYLQFLNLTTPNREEVRIAVEQLWYSKKKQGFPQRLEEKEKKSTV